MKLIITKIVRNLRNEKIPKNCYAFQYFPNSKDEICDCKVFCKFPPKGNTGIPILNPYNNISNSLTLNCKSSILK